MPTCLHLVVSFPLASRAATREVGDEARDERHKEDLTANRLELDHQLPERQNTGGTKVPYTERGGVSGPSARTKPSFSGIERGGSPGGCALFKVLTVTLAHGGVLPLGGLANLSSMPLGQRSVLAAFS
jgi:hypothetical protein